MPLTDLVAPNAIIPALKVNNKKQALQELAARAAVLSGQNERAIFDILMQREKLGSTGGRQRHRHPARQDAQPRHGCSVCSRGSTGRSISKRSTACRSISSFCCWRRKAPAPII